VLLPSGTIPYVEHDRLVPDVVSFDRGKDINRRSVMFATPAYVIHQCEKPFYEWTDVDFSAPSQECSLACLAFVPSLSFRLHGYAWKTTTVTQCLVNTCKYASRRNSPFGVTSSISFDSSICIAITKSVHKMHIAISHVGKNKRHVRTSQFTN